MQTQTITTRTELTNALEAVQKQRKDWDAGAFASSNDKLFAILEIAYDVCQACIANPDLTDGINYLLKLRGLKFGTTTSLELKIVRLVFADQGTQDKHKYRFLSYARVLRLATEAGLTSASLPQYIKDQGGIDEIRRAVSKPQGASKAEKNVTVAKKCLSDLQAPGLLDAFKLPPQLKPANGNRFSLALVRDNQDGTGTIIQGLTSNVLVETALQIAGQGILDKVASAAVDSVEDVAAKYQLTITAHAAGVLSGALSPPVTLNEPPMAAE
jgi:hypothetical protein